jgi:hypothetical protein
MSLSETHEFVTPHGTRDRTINSCRVSGIQTGERRFVLEWRYYFHGQSIALTYDYGQNNSTKLRGT